MSPMTKQVLRTGVTCYSLIRLKHHLGPVSKEVHCTYLTKEPLSGPESSHCTASDTRFLTAVGMEWVPGVCRHDLVRLTKKTCVGWGRL